MRAIVLSIVLLVGTAIGQQPKEITNSIGMKLVLIPAGTFTMGSPMEEVGRRVNETYHEVTISKSYYLGAYEVTQGEYEKVMGANPSRYKGPKNPVGNVSWNDAVSFCKKLSETEEERRAGREYRLPTEAEWEYACRAGSTTAYSFGDTAEMLAEYAWFGEVRGKTNPVGLKKPNRWGLYDMHGNVWEYCQDLYADYPPDASTDPQQGPDGGSNPVGRGGGWNYDAGLCRSAVRGRFAPRARLNYYGFRVALSPSVK
jgi:formylglycine-generating enzyme required for sulfatase activity